MKKLVVGLNVPARKDIAPKGKHIDEKLKDWGRPELVLALQKLGAMVVFTRGNNVFNFKSQTVEVLIPKIKRIDGQFSVSVMPAVIPIKSIDVIRNTISVLKNETPELNHPSLRAATANKLTTNKILAKIGLAKEYVALDIENFEQAIDTITTDDIVLKPCGGLQSKGVIVSNKAEIVQLYNDGKIDFSNQWIAEERLNFLPAIPVLGIDSVEQGKIDFANKHHLPKELRIYCFGHELSGELIHSSVMRIAPENHNNTLLNDKWVYIDQSSVPEDVLIQSDLIVKAFKQYANVSEVYIAIDWAYTHRKGETGPRWLPMEVNGGEPQLIYEKNNPSLAKDQAAKLARQLYRLALEHRHKASILPAVMQ